MKISGIATYVGPDVYALPSVELSETETATGRVLCVLPFGDYLKLRKVSKKDYMVMEGNFRVNYIVHFRVSRAMHSFLQDLKIASPSLVGSLRELHPRA